ncbi:hypothetical protein HH310_24845 [Actinoplanes sp. TBRC 11911]|uniref:hypothetical protein n=1 Tax=Actinoplanes sp. TBRC 11911 TaxID=2729386 RepID=UPI00145F7FE7|nr:hypothetical protein [Actinoplanes sp. TBRC 11911]NMO54399.1 hypothetical protein [Actinoplanes sp. TBRC 11911]
MLAVLAVLAVLACWRAGGLAVLACWRARAREGLGKRTRTGGAEGLSVSMKDDAGATRCVTDVLLYVKTNRTPRL